MEVDLCLNKDFVNELKNKIPKKILDLNFEFHNKWDPWQYVRFDDSVLNAVYFSVKDKNNKGIGREPVLKFDYINNEELWACTTCNACTMECPVNIDQVSIIIEMRRHLVMEESSAPAPLNSMFSNIENNGAPWQFSPEDRMLWAGE